MRVAFAGTPEFAADALSALHAAGHDIVLVLTQPDRPAGRGMKMQPSAVKRRAQALGAPVAQPRSLKLDGRHPDDAATAREALLASGCEVMVVAAYGLILPEWTLTLPPHGCLNIHASLLPRWRGAAPIQRAIEAGDAATGVTIMQMEAGLDTGAMLLVAETPIGEADTASTLHDRLSTLGAELIVEAVDRLGQNPLSGTPQPAVGVTYAHKIEKAEATIDWRADSGLIDRRLRAFDPFPGGVTTLDGAALKVWRGEPVAGAGDAPPGSVIDAGPDGLTVACGQGALRLTELQRPGGPRLAARDWLQRTPVLVGSMLGAPAPAVQGD